jgi:hypothetical protein
MFTYWVYFLDGTAYTIVGNKTKIKNKGVGNYGKKNSSWEFSERCFNSSS